MVLTEEKITEFAQFLLEEEKSEKIGRAHV